MRTFGKLLAVKSGVIFSLTLLFCVGCSGTVTPSEGHLSSLTVSTVGLTADGSLLLGIQQGFFREEGLDVQTTLVANPPAGLGAVQSGQIDVAFAPSISLITALSQGMDLSVVAAADGYPPVPKGTDRAPYDDTGLFVAVGSKINAVSGLRAKTIAVPARNAHLEVVIAQELADAGIDPKNGVKWVVLDYTSAVTALKNGTVDAAGLTNPYTDLAREAGAVQISAPSMNFFGSGATSLWVTHDDSDAEHHDRIAAFQRAIVRSNEYATKHPDEAVRIALEHVASPLSVSEVHPPTWPLVVTSEDLERTQQKMLRLGYLQHEVPLQRVFFTP